MTGYLQESKGLSFYQSPLMAAFPELVHGFFTRRGGVSLPPDDNLNLSLSVGTAGRPWRPTAGGSKRP